MMGVYIKGMKMPKEDMKNIMILADGRVFQFSGYGNPKPLGIAVPVPEHGDLIDYDFCMENYELLHDDDGNPVYAVKMRDINRAPTIIPADKEGEG